MIFTLPGDPIAKIRHRSCLRSGKIHSYDSQDDKKKGVAWELSLQMRAALNSGSKNVSSEALTIQSAEAYRVEFEFHIIPPLSLSYSQRSRLFWLGIPSSKPDIDNLIKFYLDCGNKVIWSDDKRIVEINASKIYSEISQTIITVSAKQMAKSNETIQGILGLFSPARYHEMLRDIKSLAEIESTPNRSQESKAADAAYVISRFADSYSDELHKIKKNYPGYWQDCISKEIIDKKGKFV